MTTLIRERTYCSDASRLRGDDNAATAARIDVWILVEFPGTWGVDPIRDAALPAPVVQALKRAGKRIPRSRVVFIRRRVECQGACRVYVARSYPRAAMTSVELPSIDSLASLPFDELLDHLQPPAQPLVLVCTHGQHDSCCGRRGYPLYDALRRRNDLDVWQCSHVGGDRFAANAVVLPWGLYYGPVEPGAAGALAESVLRNEILIPAYRGRCSMARAAQAAETFVRRATGISGREALHVVAREDLEGERIRFTVREDTGVLHEVTIEHYIAHDAARLTCTAKNVNAVPQYRLLGYRTLPV